MLEDVSRGGDGEAEQEENEEERLESISGDALSREENGAHEFAL